MLEIHEITNRLPPVRDDEPSSLRQDIADEIVDHLQVALRRDLLVHGGDEVAARHRVLDNFGDPQQVARQLWFQAMWSRIMMQRLVVGGAIFSMVVSTVIVGMVGWMMREQQRGNVALLEQIARLIPSKAEPQPSVPSEKRLDNLKIKVSIGSKDGPPAKGFEVTVSKVPKIGDVVAQEGFTQETTNGPNHSKEETIRKSVNAKTDAEGFVDCGYVEPGLYEFYVETPWNEAVASTFTVHPGHDHLEQVIAPERMPDVTDVALSLGMPDDLDQKRFALVISFHPIGSRNYAGHSWSRGGRWYIGDTTPFLMVVPRHGIWISQVRWNSGNPRWPDSVFHPHEEQQAKWKQLEPPYRFQIPAQEYSVSFDFIRAPLNDRPDDPNWAKNVLYDYEDSALEWREGQRSHEDPDVVKLAALHGKINVWKFPLPKPVLKGWIARPAKRSEQSQYQPGTEPFLSAVRDWFPFGIEQPSFIRELRFVNFGPVWRSRFTPEQERTVVELTGKCREFFDNHQPAGEPTPEEIEMWRAKFEEFDKQVVDVLSPDQKTMWEDRKKSLVATHQHQRNLIFDLNRELSNASFARDLDLTPKQAIQVRRRVINSRNVSGDGNIVPQESVKENEENTMRFLTPDQQAVWEQRKKELKQELDVFEKKQAAKDAKEEANPSTVLAPRPSAQTQRGRGAARQRADLLNINPPATDQDRILELQQQVEALKGQLEKLKAASSSTNRDE